MKTLANPRYDGIPPGRKDAPAGQFEGELQGVSHTSYLPHETSASKGLSPSGSLDSFDVVRQHCNDWLIPEPLTQDRCLAARFYRAEFGWVVHLLATPDDLQISEKERGKKPILTEWRKWTVAQGTDRLLPRYFGDTICHNLGLAVGKPYVTIDLDSKADHGGSMQACLNAHPQLSAVSCERTAGSAHLQVIGRDFPMLRRRGIADAKDYTQES